MSISSSFVFLYHDIHFKTRFKPYSFMSVLFEGHDIKLVTWSKMRDFFSKILPYKNYLDTILWYITIVLYSERETEIMACKV